MRQVIYCVSLLAIWLCSTATIICLLNFGGLGLVLIAGASFASFVSSVALVEEFVEWRHTETSPVKRLLLPPAS
jgi:NADH:ubiquinone oxidoreductase subunit 6 (subunit J)